MGISYLGGWNKKQLVFLTPLWFGLGERRLSRIIYSYLVVLIYELSCPQPMFITLTKVISLEEELKKL